jgi:hypothetical protein
MAEEIVEANQEGFARPELCLRFSMGLENAGEGRLHLVGDCCSLDPAEPHRPVVTLHQRRWVANEPPHDCTSDLSCAESDPCLRLATCIDESPGSGGRGELHAYHGHFHYEEIWQTALRPVAAGWRPGDPPPQLGEPVAGAKLGFEPTNEYMTDWHSFYQSAQESSQNKGGWVELPPGWGDIYEWNRGGNYVDFPHTTSGAPVSGYYVLELITDPLNRVIESNEDDNNSYALIQVHADGDVDLLERGYGTDPWDGGKVVLTTSP